MTRNRMHVLALGTLLTLIVLGCGEPAEAGPPLICHTIEIGEAKSLPWAGPNWRDVRQDYDANRLVGDTLALLAPETPVLVRMETLRRATVYAMWSRIDREVGYKVANEKVADELMARLMDRVKEAMRTNRSPALALFDAGYLMESYKQASRPGAAAGANKLDGYGMVRKAAGLKGNPAEMQFALAIISLHPRQPQHEEHLRLAVGGAQEGSMLARHLVIHFSDRGRSMSALRSQLVSSRN